MSGHVPASFERGYINQLSIAGMLLCNSSLPGMVVFLFFTFPNKRGSRLQNRGAGRRAGASAVRWIVLACVFIHSEELL